LVGFSPIDILREISTSRVLIFAGGTHFVDEGRVYLRRLKAHLGMFLLTLWAKMCGVKIAQVSVGVGPIRSRVTMFLASFCFGVADFVSVRDGMSEKTLLSLFCPRKSIHALDPTILVLPEPVERPKGQATKTLGVSVLPLVRLFNSQRYTDVEWIKVLAGVLRELTEREKGIRIKVIEFCGHESYGDGQISKFLIGEIGRPSVTSIVSYSSDLSQTVKAVATCDWFVGMRYHSALFAMSLRVPTVLLSYSRKCSDLAEEFGLGNAVIEAQDLTDAERLKCKLGSVLENPEIHVTRVDRTSQIRRACDGIPDSSLLGEWCAD
jgi:polysaccharide pyruvyl transferase WcaK-like protein